MTLKDLITAEVRETGPMTVADYMATCLMHPKFGYYATRDPFGTKGDFTTAPEISQMFGELLGLALAQAWSDRSAPTSFNLVELGPGRGTLMADLLRATRAMPGFLETLDLHLVETSPTLRRIQSRTIAHPLTHHDSIDTLPDGPLFLIANEFFDALPIRQFQREGKGWRERRVGLEGDTLTVGLSEPTAPAFLDHRLADTKDGDLVEVCPAAQTIAQSIGARIARDGGMALIIDYGDWRSLGDTLQALKAHKPIDPLAAPGTSDLTAHVDFEALAQAAAPAEHARLTAQGVFLERLGITERARAIAKSLSGADLENHIAAHRRLTHPQEMGTLFKVLALFQKDSPPPFGVSQ